MARKRSDESVPAKEAERIATEALRRILTTPPQPQKEIVGKVGRKSGSNKQEKSKT